MSRLHPLALLGLLLALLVWAGLWLRPEPRQPVSAPASLTFGFTPADGLFLAERDVQWTGTTPHCIVRLVLAAAPEALATYAEAPLEWCSGVD